MTKTHIHEALSLVGYMAIGGLFGYIVFGAVGFPCGLVLGAVCAMDGGK